MNRKTRMGQNYIIRQFKGLGTFNYIKVYDSCDEGLIDCAVARVVEIDDRMSVFKPNSDISRINRFSGIKPVVVHPETLRLLGVAKTLGDYSEGAFDITIRPLVELWGINKKMNYVPSQNEIYVTKKLVNYKDIYLDNRSGTAFLKEPGQALDLGGIAKGYAADQVKRILINGGVKKALINLGGNVVAIGSKNRNMPWNIGIQNPLAPTGEFFGAVSLKNKTIVTSAGNERFFVKDGVLNHHILNPLTGRPAKSGLLSITVICSTSVLADALSTAIFILGIEKGLKLLKRFKADGVFVADDSKIFVTEGLQKCFDLIGAKNVAVEQGEGNDENWEA